MQLGDRLPGAFEIMAKAVGVSTSELGDMMKAGKVMAADVLPKFAIELDKAFGADKIEAVDTLAAAENRATNAWTNFVDGLNSGNGIISKSAKGLLGLGTEVLKLITTKKELSDTIFDEQISLNMLIGRITSINEENAERKELIEQLKVNYPDLVSFIENEDYSNQNLIKTLNQVNENYRERIALQIQLEEENELLKERDKVARMCIVAENNLYKELHSLNNKYNLGLVITRDNLQDTADKLQQVGKNNFSVWETSRVEYYQHTLGRLLPTLDDVNKKYDDLIRKNKEVSFSVLEKIPESRRQYLEGKWDREQAEIRAKAKEEAEKLAAEETEKERKEREKAEKEELDINYKIAEQKIQNEIAVTEDYEQQLNLRRQAVLLWYAYEISKAGDNAKQKELIKLQYDGKIRKLDDDSVKDIDENNKKKTESEKKAAEKRYEIWKKVSNDIKALAYENERFENEKSILALRKELEGLNQGTPQYYAKLLEIREAEYKYDKAHLEYLLAVENAKEVKDPLKIKELENGLAALDIELETDKIKNAKDALASFEKTLGDIFSNGGFENMGGLLSNGFIQSLENVKNWKEGAAEAMKAVSAIYADMFAKMKEISDAYYDNEFKKLEKEKEVALKYAGENTVGREAIEEQYNARRLEIKRQQAKQEKEMAIFQAVINTATGVVAALANPGGPAGIILAALVGALGAVQIASISSQPLPAFWKGTQNSPEGWAIVDELRPEVHTDKHGNPKSFGSSKGANLRYLEKGDKIFPSFADFHKEMSSSYVDSSGSIHFESNGISALEMDAIMSRHIGSQARTQTVIDETGFNTFVIKGQSKTKLKNRRTKYTK